MQGLGFSVRVCLRRELREHHRSTKNPETMMLHACSAWTRASVSVLVAQQPHLGKGAL